MEKKRIRILEGWFLRSCDRYLHGPFKNKPEPDEHFTIPMYGTVFIEQNSIHFYSPRSSRYMYNLRSIGVKYD